MSEAHHIALVLHDFPAGGTERIAIRLADFWARAGRRVTILCGTEAGPARALVSPDIPVREIVPAIPRGRDSRRRLGRALAGPIAALAPDIVVGPGNYHLPVLGTLAKALGGTRPAIACKLSNPLRRLDRGPIAQALFELWLRHTVRGIERLAAMSEGLAAEAAYVVAPGKIAVVPGPNLPDPPLPRAPHDGIEIVAAGRLVPQKNFALALRAFALLGDPAARLTILGDGPERDMLRRLAADLCVADRVAMPGLVPDIAPWLARADAFLLTSRYEGYPSVLIEAIAAGVPVVTTPCSPAIDEIVADRRSGRMASPDAARLAGAIAEVLASGPPAEEERARLRARHAPEASAAAWLELLDRIVRERRR